MRRRDPLVTHNERVKLLATTLNALGLGLFGYAVLRPMVDGGVRLDAVFAVWCATGLALHVVAHYLLAYPEKEAGP
jgi:hypothetical protein